MKILVGFLFSMFFLQLLYSLDGEVGELLKIAPEDETFLHEHMYMPEMNLTKEAPDKENNSDIKLPESAPPSNPEVKNDSFEEKEKLSLEKPNFMQIFLISLVVIILIVYRIRLKKGKLKN